MAKRPVFIPLVEGRRLVKTETVEFTWHAGLSVSQKRKSIRSLHNAISESLGIAKILEISSKSEVPLGIQASAFNLQLCLHECCNTVETFFQGSKKFEYGGPFTDLYKASSREAKKDSRLKSSGRLVCFDLFGDEWPIVPKTAFYDWLYISALAQNTDVAAGLLDYQGFTDIEFNPKKSLNCQAYAAALYVLLQKRHLIDEALESRESFIRVIIGY